MAQERYEITSIEVAEEIKKNWNYMVKIHDDEYSFVLLKYVGQATEAELPHDFDATIKIHDYFEDEELTKTHHFRYIETLENCPLDTGILTTLVIPVTRNLIIPKKLAEEPIRYIKENNALCRIVLSNFVGSVIENLPVAEQNGTNAKTLLFAMNLEKYTFSNCKGLHDISIKMSQQALKASGPNYQDIGFDLKKDSFVTLSEYMDAYSTWLFPTCFRVKIINCGWFDFINCFSNKTIQMLSSDLPALQETIDKKKTDIFYSMRPKMTNYVTVNTFITSNSKMKSDCIQENVNYFISQIGKYTNNVKNMNLIRVKDNSKNIRENKFTFFTNDDFRCFAKKLSFLNDFKNCSVTFFVTDVNYYEHHLYQTTITYSCDEEKNSTIEETDYQEYSYSPFMIAALGNLSIDDVLKKWYNNKIEQSVLELCVLDCATVNNVSEYNAFCMLNRDSKIIRKYCKHFARKPIVLGTIATKWGVI